MCVVRARRWRDQGIGVAILNVAPVAPLQHRHIETVHGQEQGVRGGEVFSGHERHVVCEVPWVKGEEPVHVAPLGDGRITSIHVIAEQLRHHDGVSGEEDLDLVGVL